MGIKIKLVERESEMQAAFALRIQVFVLEQSVPEDEELDEYDSTATLLKCFKNSIFPTCSLKMMATISVGLRQGLLIVSCFFQKNSVMVLLLSSHVAS